MIIVTGGAGFIGSNLLAGLERAGLPDIVVCDDLGDGGKWKNIAKREIRDFVHPENLFDYLDDHRDEVDIIFHLGAIADTTEHDADLIIHNNFVLPRELWKWCGENSARFVYASSYSAYGDGQSETGFKDDDSLEALSHLKPMNPYGWSKVLFDKTVARQVQQAQTDQTVRMPPQWVGLRFFNVYGPHEYHKGEHASVVSKLYPQVSAGASARLFKSYSPDYGDGEQIRDFIYVDDCVDVLLWFYQNKDKSGLFNVGSGEGRSFNDVAKAMFDANNKPVKISYIDMPQDLKDKYQYYTQADVSKLRQAGYLADFTSLEAGISHYVTHYLSKEDPYK